MPQLANYSINETDLTFSTSKNAAGVYGVVVRTVRGEINNPKRIISSWPQFLKYYGGISSSYDDQIICKKALDGGAKLRVCNVKEYTDINNAGTLTATKATLLATKSATFTATDLKAGDTIVVTLNGTPSSTIPFTVNHNTTMDLIAATIVADFPVIVTDAMVVKNPTPGASNRTIVIAQKSGAAPINTHTIVVTGGAPGVPTVSFTTLSAMVNSSTATLLTITPIAEGAEYNKLVAYVMPPSNKQAAHFDLVLKIIGDSVAYESYKNLKILAVASAAQQSGLAELSNSALAVWTTPDLSAETDLDLLTGIYTYENGSDGTTPVTSPSFIGASTTKTGFYSFDAYGDLSALAVPGKGISEVAISQALSSYVSSRRDMVGLLHIDNSYTTADAINTAIDALNIDSSYVGFYGGGNSTFNPVTGDKQDISELGDVLALIAKTHANFGFHYSYAGRQRGVISNSLGPVTNFGTPGMKAEFEQIAANRANMVISRDNKVFLWGNFTGQKANSALSFMNVRFMVIDIKKTLAPILEEYIEEQNLPSTWKKLYFQVRNYFNTLADNKALYGGEGKGWDWQGDQFAKEDLSDLVVNNPAAVGLGRYEVNLFIKPVPSLQDIKLSIILTPAGISIEETVNLL